MERESFEDEEVAKLLNERFVSIKVDREERPDIDSVYMSVCQLMAGQGGWPLNVFLTPDQVPFYAGTYFPKEDRYGRPGIKDVVVQLYDTYINEPEKVTKVGEQIKAAIQPKAKPSSLGDLSMETVEAGFESFLQAFDLQYGGFGDAPKFPTPHNLMFLLRYYRATENERALEMVEKTLDGLARGGIYDHIGFGFSRYSTDNEFLVPHFEKMLYDNALLAIANTETYQLTKKPELRKTAEEIFTYVLRDMQHPDGGFYSAEDADSEGVEGKFYVWTPSEVESVLGDELGELYCAVYDITEHGNFEGKNIPNLINQSLHTFALQNELDIDKLKDQLETARKQLFEHREKRQHPYKDDKILTAWNALMIAALAKSSRVFEKAEYLDAAKKAITFIENQLIIDGRVMVRYREGEVKEKGFLDDYAYLLWAFIELYEATFDLSYLQKTKQLATQMIDLFLDEQNGGFYFYGKDQEKLLVRQKEAYDGALPSGNSVAALQLLRLARLSGDFKLEEIVQGIFQAFSVDVRRYPAGHAYMLQAFVTTQIKMKEIVLIGDHSEQQAFLSHLQQEFYPEVTYLRSDDQLKEFASYTATYHQEGIYICENFVCHQPVLTAEEAIQLLAR